MFHMYCSIVNHIFFTIAWLSMSFSSRREKNVLKFKKVTDLRFYHIYVNATSIFMYLRKFDFEWGHIVSERPIFRAIILLVEFPISLGSKTGACRTSIMLTFIFRFRLCHENFFLHFVLFEWYYPGDLKWIGDTRMSVTPGCATHQLGPAPHTCKPAEKRMFCVPRNLCDRQTWLLHHIITTFHSRVTLQVHYICYLLLTAIYFAIYCC